MSGWKNGFSDRDRWKCESCFIRLPGWPKRSICRSAPWKRPTRFWRKRKSAGNWRCRGTRTGSGIGMSRPTPCFIRTATENCSGSGRARSRRAMMHGCPAFTRRTRRWCGRSWPIICRGCRRISRWSTAAGTRTDSTNGFRTGGGRIGMRRASRSGWWGHPRISPIASRWKKS